ncbi:hypothetical protein GDO78_008793 [Eleutherodactylus coqui]|uniref:3-beta hydroxysteroid dehydrogenase/isomerase domain-containing protein n=1 Tax=Eleutherodactylus coqui TaxID=57060 RepID=A0A8J6FFN4_ELECQ|nr:hypothetical protein GDO78_008793 [Eleutherodactylus coqui]
MARDLVYLVTGGCGFIGEWIVRLLLKEDYVTEVKIFDLNESEAIKLLRTASTAVTFVEGDITDYSQILSAVKGVDVVIHTAAIVDILDIFPFKKLEAINVGGTENVVNACLAMDVSYLVYTSSLAAVGPNTNNDPMVRVTEDTFYPGEPSLSYGRTKAQAEKLTRLANGQQVMKCKYMFSNVAWMHLLAARQMQLHPNLMGGQAYYAYDDTPFKQRFKLNHELFTKIDHTIQIGRRIPYWKIWLIVVIQNLLKVIVKPFWSLKPFMTLSILKLVSIAYCYDTDKAFRHFGYKPLFTWLESKQRTCRWLKQEIQGQKIEKEN